MSWSNHKLGDYCEVIAGQSPEGKYYNDSGDGLPFYQGKKEFGDRYIGVPQKWTTKVTKKAKAGDILMSVRAPVGPINFSTENICIGRGLAAIRPSDKLDKDFLFYYLLSKQDEIQGSEGAVFASINKSQIEGLNLLYVGLEEQKRIVAILDQAFADIDKARALTEQNLKNARELFESYLQQLFSLSGDGWLKSTLGEITGGVFTGPFGSLLHKSDYIEDGIPLVNPAHITPTGIEIDYQKTVSKETAEKLSSYKMKIGDIVIGRRGEMGRCALVTDIEEGFLCGTGSFFIKSSNQVSGSYLVRYLRSDFCRTRLEKIAGGAVMPNLSNSDLSDLILNLPPLDEQRKLARKIDNIASQVEDIQRIYNSKLQFLDDLKRSLLKKAFSGGLTKAGNEVAA
ncbi:MAG: restriction endonuclease subunit S [Pseudomonadales bacterium]|nr:restriction endonuclease subunit S [Pseudomonadales bacterium]|tara:strand:+ start:85 stop:1278 length:1194 start_codon:yes stop_codon:yes gene_type:complete